MKFSLPFLSRVTTGFIAYDLVKQIQNFNKGNKEAFPNIVGDSLILSVDVAEVGIELAELGGVIQGVSSVTGPIGMAIGAITFVGLDIYSAVKSVEKIDQQIHLTGWEKFKEEWRAFLYVSDPHLNELSEIKHVLKQYS